MINKDYLLVDQSLFNMFNKSIKEGVWVKARRGSSKWAGQQVRHHSLRNLENVKTFGQPFRKCFFGSNYGVWLCEYFGPQKLWAKFVLTCKNGWQIIYLRLLGREAGKMFTKSW